MFPNITSMRPPATREEFEERVNLTRELLIIGKIHPQGMDGMANVRLLPNGRIDMLSINESTRLISNQMHMMHTTDFGDTLRELGRESEG